MCSRSMIGPASLEIVDGWNARGRIEIGSPMASLYLLIHRLQLGTVAVVLGGTDGGHGHPVVEQRVGFEINDLHSNPFTVMASVSMPL
jgi:hypothetical protein